MKYLFLFLLWSLNTCHLDQEPTTYFEIDFQDGFKNDLIGLKIEDEVILKNVKVTSDPYDGVANIDGLTGSEIKYIAFDCFKSKNNLLIQREGKTELLKKLKAPKGDVLTMDVMLNGKWFRFNVDLSQGKYIGFGKSSWESNEIRMEQSHIVFEYD